MEHSEDSMEEEVHELVFNVRMRNNTFFRVVHFCNEEISAVKIDITKLDDPEENEEINADKHLEQEELAEEVCDNFKLMDEGEDQEEADKTEPEPFVGTGEELENV